MTEQLSSREIAELAQMAGLPQRQINLVIASNAVFGTEHALAVIKAFEKINDAGREAQKGRDE